MVMAQIAAELTQVLDERFARVAQYDALEITSVVTTSMGAPDGSGLGSIGGQGSFPLRFGGNALGVGDTVWARQTNPGSSAPEYEYVLLISSPNPGGGFLLTDANIPYPLFDGAPGGGLDTSGGSITAWMLINFLQVEEKFRPSGYQISWKPASTSLWKDEHAVHIPGQTTGLFRIDGLTQGAQYDVKLSTEVNWAQRQSPAGPTSTFTAAADTVSPATLTGIDVSVQTPGQLVIVPLYSMLDLVHFQNWELSVATNAAGAGAKTYFFDTDAFTYAGLPDTPYYVALKGRAKNGTYGNRILSNPTQWLGPYQYAVATPPLDTTPPPVWAAPTLAQQTTSPATGGEEYWLTITLPAYSTPADYLETIATVAGTGFAGQFIIPGGSASTKVRVQAVGLLSVTLIGADKLGNKSAASPAATITITPTGVPAGMGNVTTQSSSESVIVRWTAIANVLRYRVYRATTAGGAGSTPIAEVDGHLWPDLFTGNGAAGTVYYYKVLAWNINGDGLASPTWIAGTVGAIDGRNLVALTVTAASLEANLVLASTIRTPMAAGGYIGLYASDSSLTAYNASSVKTLSLVGGGLDFYRDGVNLRARLLPTGIYIYRDSGDVRTSLLKEGLYIEGLAGGQFSIAEGSGGFTHAFFGMQDFAANASVTLLYAGNWIWQINGSSPFQTFTWDALSATELGFTPSHAGMGINFGSAYTRAREVDVGATATTFETTAPYRQYHPTAIGSAAGNFITQAYWEYPVVNGQLIGLRLLGNRGPLASLGDNYDARFRFESLVGGGATAKGGYLDLGQRGYSPYWGLGDDASGTVLYWDQPNAQIVTTKNLRVGNGAQTLRSFHNGTDAGLDWTAGGLYLGWGANPALTVNIGNGASNYGVIKASAFTVSSARASKSNIRDLDRVAERFAALRPRRYTRHGSPAEGEMLGFIAEELEELIPEAVTAATPVPDGEDGATKDGGKGVDLYALLPVIVGYVRELAARVAELEAPGLARALSAKGGGR